MFERIVAAIDSDPERSARVVEAAQELAQKFGSEVVVAHVRDVERPQALVAPTARPGALQPVVHFESEEEARALVDAAVNRLRSAGVRADGQIAPGTTGSTARELLTIAQSHGATLIVVGDRGSHVTDVLLGSVAYRIVHRAECPVLLVR
jgi:nucleotide-binding universal stress UspA family protein